MNEAYNYIGREENVYSVPYDVINEDDGNQYIYVLDEGEDDLKAEHHRLNRRNNQVRKMFKPVLKQTCMLRLYHLNLKMV